jgi:hypothetical protein
VRRMGDAISSLQLLVRFHSRLSCAQAAVRIYGTVNAYKFSRAVRLRGAATEPAVVRSNSVAIRDRKDNGEPPVLLDQKAVLVHPVQSVPPDRRVSRGTK